MLAIAEGAAILAHRLGDETETPALTNNVITEISYSTNHNYYIQLKDRKEKIIDKQMPLPTSVSRTFKTTVNNQKIVEVVLFADIENGEYDKMTIGYFTIEEELPVGSDIVFNIEMDLDEIFKIKNVHISRFAVPSGTAAGFFVFRRSSSSSSNRSIAASPGGVAAAPSASVHPWLPAPEL